MSESERTRVGRALDSLRDALASYVDKAMVESSGSDWDERVAAEDAQRFHKPKRHVSKSDLAVMLKVIQHRKIEPWSLLGEYPRIRVHASELLSVRNLHAHGGDCVDELSRMLDTAGRLLRALAIPIPDALEPTNVERAGVQGDKVVAVVAQQPRELLVPFEAEFARLGPSGERLAEILARAVELKRSGDNQLNGRIRAVKDGEISVDDILDGRTTARIIATGAEVVDLIAETYLLEIGVEQPKRYALEALALTVRCELSEPEFAASVLAHSTFLKAQALDRRLQLVLEDFKNLEHDDLLQSLNHRIDELERVVPDPKDRWERWREVIRLAGKLNDGDMLSHVIILIGNSALLDSLGGSAPHHDGRDQELSLVRDSIARTRMLAGQQPGSTAETALVALLRREGKICSNLGRSDEAIQAFARADEIIDRYPAADPNLR